jgi:hypothetical protein
MTCLAANGRSSGAQIKDEIVRIKTQYKISSLKNKWLRLT